MSIQDDPNLAGEALNERLWRARALKAESRAEALEAAAQSIIDKHDTCGRCHCPTCDVLRAALAGKESGK